MAFVLCIAGLGIALILLLLSLLGIHPSIEHPGMNLSSEPGTVPIGHMSPITSFCFLLTGMTLLFLMSGSADPGSPNIRAFFAAGALTGISVVLVLAYLLGGPLLYHTHLIPPALPTSLGFLVLGAGLIRLSNTSLGQRVQQILLVKRAGHIRAILVFLIVVAAVLLIAVLHFQRVQRQYRAGIEAQLSTIADLKVRELQQWREERFGDARVLYHNTLFADVVDHYFARPADQSAYEQLQTWLREIQVSYRYAGVQLIDSQGRIRLSVPEQTALTPDQYAQEMAEASRAREVSFLDFHRDAPGDPIHLSLIVPILPGAGAKEPIGALVLRIDPDVYLYPLLERWPGLHRTGETLLVRQEGDSVVFLNNLKYHRSAALNLRVPMDDPHLPAARAIQGESGIITGKDYRDRRVAAALQPVPDSPWYMVARMETGEIYAPLRQQLWWVIFMTTAVLLSVGLAGAFYWERHEKLHYLALSRSRAKHQATLRSIGDGVIITDADGMVNYLNPMAESMTGWASDDAQGRPATEIFQVVNEETEEPVDNPAEYVLREGKQVGLANHSLLISKDGRRIPIADSGAPIRTEQDEVFGVVLVFQDQTEERENARRIAASESRYRGLFEHMESGFALHEVLTDAEEKPIDSRFLEMNAAFTRLTRISRAAIGERVTEVFPDLFSEPEDWITRFGNVALDGTPTQFVACSNTLERWFAVSAYSPEPGTFATILHDITAHKETELELRRNEEWFRTLTETAPDVIILHGLDGTIHYVNHAAESLLGRQPGEVVGRSVVDFFPPDEQTDMRHRQQVRKSGDQETLQYETEIIDSEGQPVPIEARSTPVRTGAHDETRIMVVARDLRERRALERQLLHAQQVEALGQVAGGIAHDFNNVLNTISNAVQLIDMNTTEVPTIGKYLKMAMTSITQGQTITNRLVTFTQQGSSETRSVALQPFLEEMRDIVVHILPKNIEIVVSIPDTPALVKANPDEIRQVLMNLCINAKQAMPDGGGITLGYREPAPEEVSTHVSDDGGQSFWCVTVTDTGPGIAPEVQEHIFEPFFTTKVRTEGAGLGLAIAHKIVRNHDGWIAVQSIPDEGTTFSIGLPLTTESEPDSVDQPDVLTTPSKTGTARILVVEDDAISQEILIEFLTEKGYRVTAVSDGRSAAEAYEAEPESFDLVITDLGLPELPGQELIGELLAIDPATQAIAITGYVETENTAALLELGFQAVVKKPYQLPVLGDHVEKVLQQ